MATARWTPRSWRRRWRATTQRASSTGGRARQGPQALPRTWCGVRRCGGNSEAGRRWRWMHPRGPRGRGRRRVPAQLRSARAPPQADDAVPRGRRAAAAQRRPRQHHVRAPACRGMCKTVELWSVCLLAAPASDRPCSSACPHSPPPAAPQLRDPGAGRGLRRQPEGALPRQRHAGAWARACPRRPTPSPRPARRAATPRRSRSPAPGCSA